MKKNFFIILILTIILVNTCSCTLLRKPLDKRSGFTNYLRDIEENIRNENWDNAKDSLESSIKIWSKLKPIFQIDIDHDYANDIDSNFIKLEGYIDVMEKPDSLTAILLIQNTWKRIGEL